MATGGTEPPDEPLQVSAAVAWRLAQTHCRRDPATGETCAWNHGFWQVLRLLGLAGTAAHRGRFYRDAVAEGLAAAKRGRVLIGGAADYAMLAQVLAACREIGTEPAITVIDICETPLRLNRWYAEREGIDIETVRSDIFEWEAAPGYDVVCTDSFLGRVPHARWPELAGRWYHLLNAGGVIATASRLRPGAPAEREYFTAAQAAAFCDSVRQAAGSCGALPLDGDRLARAARAYTERHFTYVVRSAGQVRSALERAGLSVTRLDTGPGTPGNPYGAAGPSVPGDRPFLYVCARRP
jgi:hypothetical protein